MAAAADACLSAAPTARAPAIGAALPDTAAKAPLEPGCLPPSLKPPPCMPRPDAACGTGAGDPLAAVRRTLRQAGLRRRASSSAHRLALAGGA